MVSKICSVDRGDVTILRYIGNICLSACAVRSQSRCKARTPPEARLMQCHGPHIAWWNETGSAELMTTRLSHPEDKGTCHFRSNECPRPRARPGGNCLAHEAVAQFFSGTRRVPVSPPNLLTGTRSYTRLKQNLAICRHPVLRLSWRPAFPGSPCQGPDRNRGGCDFKLPPVSQIPGRYRMPPENIVVVDAAYPPRQLGFVGDPERRPGLYR